MAPKRWKRKIIVSKVSRKWVPIWRAGVCKWTLSVRGKFHTWEVEMTTVSRSQVATTRNAGDGLAVGRQVFWSHLVQTSEHLGFYEENVLWACGRSRALCFTHQSSPYILWTEPGRQRPASLADFAGNEWVPGRICACSRRFVLPCWGHVATCRSSSSECQSGDCRNNRLWYRLWYGSGIEWLTVSNE